MRPRRRRNSTSMRRSPCRPALPNPTAIPRHRCRSTWRIVPFPAGRNRHRPRSTGPNQASRPSPRCRSSCPRNPPPVQRNRPRRLHRCRSTRAHNLRRRGSGHRRWSGRGNLRRPHPNPHQPTGATGSRRRCGRNRLRPNRNRGSNPPPRSRGTRAAPAAMTPTRQTCPTPPQAGTATAPRAERFARKQRSARPRRRVRAPAAQRRKPTAGRCRCGTVNPLWFPPVLLAPRGNRSPRHRRNRNRLEHR